MKDAYYFSHDSNARNDEKMLLIREKYGWEGYGLFFGIIEILRESTDYVIKASLLGGLSLALNYPKDKLLAFVEECIDVGLLCRDDECIWSQSLLERMEIKDAMSLKFSNAGKRGAKIRWGTDSTPNNPPNSKGKESKVKERKVNKKVEDPLLQDYPHLKDSSFKELWDSWLEVRKIKKVPNTDRALKIALGKLQVHPLDTAIQMLEKAVEGGWKGIYKLKEIGNGRNGENFGKREEKSTKFSTLGREV